MTWRQRADFAALCAWLVGGVAMAVMALWWYGQDFRGYYAAARVVLAGGNPYDYAQVAPVLLQVTGRTGNNPFYYPPWFALAMTPFALIAYSPARALWMGLNVLLWLAALLTLARLLGWPAAGWRRWLMCLLATFLFAWVTWRFEQTGVLMAGLLVAALWTIQAGRWRLAGVLLAFMLTKPNASGVLVLGLLAWLARQRHWPAVVACAATLVGLLIVSTWLIPGWFQPFREPGFGRGLTDELDGPQRVVAVRINTTVLDWLKSGGISGALASGLYGAACALALGALALMIWRTPSVWAAASAAAVAGFIVTPYALQYDFPPLVVPLWFALRALSGRAGPRWYAGWAATAFALSVPFWERPISDGFWIVIAVGGLLVLALSAPASAEAAG